MAQRSQLKFFDDERCREALSDFAKILDEAIKKVTGEGSSVKDQEQSENVALILASQIELIASRTPISNVPAILAKHLQQTFNFKQLQLENKNLMTPAEAKAIRNQKIIDVVATAEEKLELKQMIVRSISEIFEMKKQGTLQPWMPQSTEDFINYFRTHIESGIDFTEIETRFTSEFSSNEWQIIKSEFRK